MNLPIVLDIETVATEAALAQPYPEAERQPPSNYKNEDAITRWRESDRAKWAAERANECALDPRLGRIVAIGYGLPCSDAMSYAVQLARAEAEESALLIDFWAQVGLSRGAVVTWNGEFDLRFLVVRSLVHGIEPTLPAEVVRSWFRRYVVRPHFDCRAVLTNWNGYASGTLAEWCAAFGITRVDDVDGSQIAGLVAAEEWSKIAAHCDADIKNTYALYQKIGRMFSEAA